MVSIINTGLCLAGIVICACRLGTRMSKENTKTIIRVQYVMWLNVDLFLLMTFPHEWQHVVMSGAILAHLLMTLPAWRYAAPPHTLKRRMRDVDFASGD
jgi:hypothetical protein